MAMIYRRNPHGGGRLTTTIPLNDALRQSQLDADNNDKDDDLASLTASSSSRGRFLSRWLRCRAWRRQKGAAAASALPAMVGGPHHALSFRVSQILWQALLVYAFFGLPVLGRILNFCRYFHRFTAASIVTGLLVGFSQDFAIFVQASTIIVLIKAIFQPVSMQRRLSAMAAASAASSSAGSTSVPLGGSGSLLAGGAGASTNTAAAATLAQERYPHPYGARYVHLPVYFPVRTNEYEMHANLSSAESDPLDPSQLNQPKHLTLVASSSSTMTSFPWSLSSSTSPASPATLMLLKVRNFFANVLVVALVKVVLVLATVASVADFCLQVTMHPRLNRAFVEIFVNYMEQFTGSLMDEEVLTPPVVLTWATYVLVVSAMTYGFYTERLPFLPDLLSFSSSSSGGASSWCCVSRVKRLSAKCTGIVRRRSYRKDSSLPPPPINENAEEDKTAKSYIKSLYRSYWRRKESDIIILTENNSGLTTSASAANRGQQQQRRRRNSSQGHGHGMLADGFGIFGSSNYSASSAGTWAKPKSPLGIVLHCIVVSVFVTLGALCASLIVHTTAAAMSRNSSKHHAYVVGVDMQLMSNPMFSLQTENFFTHKNRIGADHINCTAASATLLQTLGKSERYDTAGMGNDDSCALLWRKTVGFQGETLWNIQWNVTSETETALDGSASPSPTASAEAKPARKPRQPNIIVINMESWRYLDVGVLGGAEKKKKFGKSVTPNFDRLSQDGVLYRKHYTQCVQTTRTLLTTLFGMLPSCTETTALKMYGTGLTVRGLPQFLKSRGYFNMFWSAVDLSWEYWDKFLLANGFDKLVDDQKVRKMLHETQSYKDRDDDHFSWGMHDHLSFDMLLYALEFAKNSTTRVAPLALAEGALLNATTASLNVTATAPGSHAADAKLEAPPLAKNATQGAVSPLPTAQQVDSPSTNKMRGPNGKQQATTHASPDKKNAAAAAARGGDLASVGPANVTSSAAKRRIKPTIGWEGLREPYFIDMYTITSHNPWALPEDYAVPDLAELYTRFNKRYIDSMYFSDDMLGQFIDAMRAKGLMNNTVVIIEGDHGYGRLEHDNNPSIADSAVYDEATHVPFLILADDYLAAHERGTVVDQLTMQSDLMATMADLLGVSEQDPLLQHGHGHSMRRKRSPKPPVKDVDFDVIHKHAPDEEQEKERRVLLCNPFNGLTKGARTEELKYVFNADGSFKVFELASDPIEKKPVASGFDAEQMDDATKEMLDFVAEQVDLNQFLYETNKFVTKIPAPRATPRSRAIEEAEEVQLERRKSEKPTPDGVVVAAQKSEPLVDAVSAAPEPAGASEVASRSPAPQVAAAEGHAVEDRTVDTPSVLKAEPKA